MNATRFLKKQHRDVKALFKRLEKAEEAGERRALLREVTQKLELHTKLEEETFYPAVRGLETKKAEEMIAEAYEEHHVVDLVLEELVLHHAEEEEEEMFALARKLGDDELDALGERMAAAAGDAPSASRRAA